MRFFTPQLYVRFNSRNDDEADKANEQWEAALLEYRKHLGRVREHLPREARALTEMSLHDAELLSLEESLEPLLSIRLEPFGPEVFWGAITLLPLRQNGTLVSLIYVLSDRIRQHPPVLRWRFSKLHTHWLYDEIDVDEAQRGHFLHRILLSDGRILEIPFISAMVRRVALSPPAGGEMARVGV